MSTARVAKLGKSAESFRVALEFYYQPTKPTWEETAAACGVSSETLRKWRGDELWEITERSVREELLQGPVGRAATHAWIKALDERNPQILLRTLEHLGMLSHAKVEVNHELNTLLDIIRAETKETHV